MAYHPSSSDLPFDCSHKSCPRGFHPSLPLSSSPFQATFVPPIPSPTRENSAVELRIWVNTSNLSPFNDQIQVFAPLINVHFSIIEINVLSLVLHSRRMIALQGYTLSFIYSSFISFADSAVPSMLSEVNTFAAENIMRIVS